MHAIRTIFGVLLDALTFIRLCFTPVASVAAENLFLRKQLGLYIERKTGARPVKSVPATLKYEPGLIVAAGDFVIVHGRFSGFGLPVNWIAADILRIKNGILVEHWDVIQDEAAEQQSKSKAPMFGSAFPVYRKAR